MPGFVRWVPGIVSWVLGFVCWVLGIVFQVFGFVLWMQIEGKVAHVPAISVDIILS